MLVALEHFFLERHKCLNVAHMFVVPCLMTHLWRKQLDKDTDMMFEVLVGIPHWSLSQYEPLIVAVVLHIGHSNRYWSPWVVRGTGIIWKTKRICATCTRDTPGMDLLNIMTWKGA